MLLTKLIKRTTMYFMKKKNILGILCLLLFVLSFFLTAFDCKAPFIWPMKGPTITMFLEKYYDAHAGRTRTHTGIDIQGNYKEIVRASANGYVRYIGISPIGGRTIVIQHNEKIKSNYLNLLEIYVKRGQYVLQGEPIAAIGAQDDPSAEALHLHFAIVYDGAYLDPEDIFKIDYSSVSAYISLANLPLDFTLTGN